MADAHELSVAMEGDPQMQLPVRPAICPGLPLALTGNALIVDGLQSRRVLRGSSVRSIAPRALEILNGERTWEESAEALGLSQSQFKDLLAIFFTAGLLVDGETGAWVDDPTLTFLHRASDQTRRNASGFEANMRLRSASLAIFADDTQMENDLLQHFAQYDLHSVGVNALTDESAPTPSLLLLMVTGVNKHDSSIMSVWRRAMQAKIPVLPVHLSRTQALVGPLSLHDHGPCPICAGESWDYRQSQWLTELDRKLLLGILEQEVVLMLGEVGSVQSETSGLKVTLDPLDVDAVAIVSQPGCPYCGVAARQTTDTPLAYEFDASVAMPPARLRRPRKHQKHYEESSAKLQHERRMPLSASVRVLLPHIPLSSLAATSALDLAGVAALLEYSFGVNRARSERENAPRRWAPSGGNLGSPHAYISVENVGGLQDGRYFYDSVEHALVPIGALTESFFDAQLEITVAVEITRVWRKYGNFGYRIVHLDTGVALRHLALVASRLNLDVTNAESWNDGELSRRYLLDRNTQLTSAQIRFREKGTR